MEARLLDPGSRKLEKQAVLDALNASALRCRELAESAVDSEVAEALRELATDMGQALSLISNQPRPEDGSSA